MLVKINPVWVMSFESRTTTSGNSYRVGVNFSCVIQAHIFHTLGILIKKSWSRHEAFYIKSGSKKSDRVTMRNDMHANIA